MFNYFHLFSGYISLVSRLTNKDNVVYLLD